MSYPGKRQKDAKQMPPRDLIASCASLVPVADSCSGVNLGPGALAGLLQLILTAPLEVVIALRDDPDLQYIGKMLDDLDKRKYVDAPPDAAAPATTPVAEDGGLFEEDEP